MVIDGRQLGIESRLLEVKRGLGICIELIEVDTQQNFFDPLLLGSEGKRLKRLVEIRAGQAHLEDGSFRE